MRERLSRVSHRGALKSVPNWEKTPREREYRESVSLPRHRSGEPSITACLKTLGATLYSKEGRKVENPNLGTKDLTGK